MADGLDGERFNIVVVVELVEVVEVDVEVVEVDVDPDAADEGAKRPMPVILRAMFQTVWAAPMSYALYQFSENRRQALAPDPSEPRGKPRHDARPTGDPGIMEARSQGQQNPFE